jgi:hypothetical protein
MIKELNNLDIFKKLASRNVKTKLDTVEDVQNYLERWYRKKYNLADTDPRFLNQYMETIAVEFFEDYFENNPKELEAFTRGFESVQKMEDAEAREIMGDQYTDEIAYLERPPTNKEEELVESF